MRQSLLGHRIVFAALITYMATQAHGWAGGLATRPSVTLMTWFGVTIASSFTKNRFTLLVIALGTQLGIHFGTAGVHAHCDMQISMNQMTIGHIIAGTIAWLLLIVSERAFLSALEALAFVVVRVLRILECAAIEFTQSTKFFVSQIGANTRFILHIVERRGPPIFSM